MKDIKCEQKNAIIIGVFFLIAIITLLYCKLYVKVHNAKIINETSIYSMSPELKDSLTEDQTKDKIMEEINKKIAFYADTFGIDYETLYNRIEENYEQLELKDNENADIILIDYLMELEVNEKELFNKKIIPYTGNKEYIVSLIKYYTDIYSAVDFNIAAAIAEIESCYTVKSMLNVNNVYGGLVNGRLLKYPNIEYGVLKYIKLLNDGYFTKGLDTVETIGRVYNPIQNEDGVKIANPNWVKNVTNALDNYNEITSIDIEKLINIKESM